MTKIGDWNMNLIDKSRLLCESIKSDYIVAEGWEIYKSQQCDTYYKDYKRSIHYGDNPIMLFDYESPREFKEMLDRIWDGNAHVKKSLLAFMVESIEEDENMLPNVDTHNYMM